MEFQGRELISGEADGYTLTLGAPLSLWDGLDLSTGIIVQIGHPNKGQSIDGTILVFANGLSGATASISLTECLREGYGPVALILPEADATVVGASVVAGELYDKQIPILQLTPEEIIQIPNGLRAEINNGVLTIDKKSEKGE